MLQRLDWDEEPGRHQPKRPANLVPEIRWGLVRWIDALYTCVIARGKEHSSVACRISR